MSVRKRATGVLETGGFCYEERSVLFGKTARATTSAVASKDNGVQVANRMDKTILGAKDKGEENVISIKGTTGRQGSLVLVCRRLPLYSGTLYPNYATKNGGKRFISFRERTRQGAGKRNLGYWGSHDIHWEKLDRVCEGARIRKQGQSATFIVGSWVLRRRTNTQTRVPSYREGHTLRITYSIKLHEAIAAM